MIVDMTSPTSDRDEIVLMADPQVAAIPVDESGEKLTDLRDRAPLIVSPLLADAEGAYAQARTGVADRLVHAAAALPSGLRLMVFECFRPPALQKQIFDGYSDTLRRAHPDWDAVALRMAASRFVSPPELAPHSAGAAVDLTLCAEDGTELDMGCPLNATPEESDGACYTGHPVGAEARHHRTVLGAALAEAGFVNYPTEWWHWSFGDRYWALQTGAKQARYGPAY